VRTRKRQSSCLFEGRKGRKRRKGQLCALSVARGRREDSQTVVLYARVYWLPTGTAGAVTVEVAVVEVAEAEEDEEEAEEVDVVVVELVAEETELEEASEVLAVTVVALAPTAKRARGRREEGSISSDADNGCKE
jgi:hypothetical protein